MSSDIIDCCLNCANSVTSSGNSWLELFLTTFLGFLSALAVEALWANHKDNQLKNQIKENLKKELISIKKQIEELQDDRVYMKPYSIPIWKGACESGSILVLDKCDGFFQLIELYSLIEEANLVEMKAFEISNMENVKNTKACIQLAIDGRNRIKSSIDSVVNSLEGR